MGYVIIPKPNLSSREGIKSRCFDLLVLAVFAQSVAALTTVVAIQVVAVPTGHWRSTVTAVTVVAALFNLTLVWRLGFRDRFWCFSPIQYLLGQTEMRTHEKKDLQLIRTV